MPRYFFHLRHEGDEPDTTGVDLPGPKEAWEQAVGSFTEALHDMDGTMTPGPEWSMDVTGEGGKVLWRLHFSAERVDW